MESCPTQAVLPLVGLAAEKVIHDRYNVSLMFGVGLGKRVARRRPLFEIGGFELCFGMGLARPPWPSILDGGSAP
ncbi:MAG: hypothetical protein ACQESR_17355 [Planctomycetota bacterium]